jgi:hypothetical protein
MKGVMRPIRLDTTATWDLSVLSTQLSEVNGRSHLHWRGAKVRDQKSLFARMPCLMMANKVGLVAPEVRLICWRSHCLFKVTRGQNTVSRTTDGRRLGSD